jgi:hypothetical protein
MKFNFDSEEPVKGVKESFLSPFEKSLIIVGVGAAVAIIVFKWLAAASRDLADIIFPSLF